MSDSTTIKSNVFVEDLALAIGGTGAVETGTRKTSTGGLVTLSKLDLNHLKYRTRTQLLDNSTSSDYVCATRAEIDAAITAIGSTEAVIKLLRGTIPITSDLTIPANITVRPERGAILAITAGKVLTISGKFESGLYQVFSGAGSVTFSEGSAWEFYPEWWGAVGDGVVDDTVAIGQCWSVMDNISGNMKLSAGAYKTSGSLTITERTGIFGNGLGLTTINYTGTDYWLKVPALTKTDHVHLEDFDVSITGAGLGVLQHQDSAQAFDNTKMSQWWVIRNVKGVGNNVAASVGLSLTQLADSTFSGVIDFSEFATQALCDRTTRNKYYNPKVTTSSVLHDSIGIEWRVGDAVYSLQEDCYSPTIMPLHTDAIGIKMDAAGVSIFAPYYEKLTASAAKCFLQLTANVQSFKQFGGKYGVAAGTLGNLILADDAPANIYQRGVFVGDELYGTGQTCSFGTTGSKQAWQFVAPNETMMTALRPAIIAERVGVEGSNQYCISRTPGACANRAAAQSITTDTPTLIIFDGEAWDSDTMVDIGTAPTKITVNIPGVYAISANILFAEDHVNVRYIRVLMGGASYIAGIEVPAGTQPGSFLSVSAIYNLAAGAYLELEVYQDGAATLNVTQARLTVQRISSLD